jgi:hypothetical protein
MAISFSDHIKGYSPVDKAVRFLTAEREVNRAVNGRF